MKPPRAPRRRPTPAAPPPAGFVISWVDEPRPGAMLQPGGLLSGKGWAVSEAEIASIGIYLGDSFLGYASYGQPRPEIGRDFPHYPQSHHAGFAFSIRLGTDLAPLHGADLEFRFRTGPGGESRRMVKLAWPAPAGEASPQEDAARPWPIRLGLEECRVDQAGRLRLRGWAVARAPLTALQLYLGETLLGAPERGLERPDIAKRFPNYPDAALSGFLLVQHLPTPPDPDATVRVVARGPHMQRQIISPLTRPQAGRALLHANDVTLCCETLRVSADDRIFLAGWAVGPAETRQIEVLSGDVPLGMAEIGLPRPDIGNRFPSLPGARHAGFRFGQARFSAATPCLTLLVRDSAGGERRLELRLPQPADDAAEGIHAGIDEPKLQSGRAIAATGGSLRIAGWATATQGLAGVEIWSGETKLGDAFLGIRREDIFALHPDLPESLTSGFALTVPHRRIGDGEHDIRVLIRGRTGATSEENFRVTMLADDDSKLGAVRRMVPHAETALRMEVLERGGAVPSFVLIIREAGPELRGLAATLDSLRRQSLDRWHGILVMQTPATRAAATALIAEAGLTGRIAPVLASAASRLWRGPADAAQPEFLCVVRAGDRLGADALMELAVEARLSGADFIYADERCHDRARDSLRPFFKPGWSPDLLLSTNYIGRAWCARRDLVRRARLDMAGILRGGDYASVLLLTEQAVSIAHVPLSLYERGGRRLELPATEHAALQQEATRRGIVADVLPGRVAGSWRLRRAVHTTGLVSVIIPTCGARGLILNCLAGLRGQTRYANLEIICLDDIPADQPDLKTWLRGAADRVIDGAGPFNWSRANNIGAAAARGEFLLFLNDDTEMTDPDWLDALLEHAQRPEVGVVGPQLLYADGKVQHAGMFLRGAEGVHAFRFAAADEPGPFGLALTQRDVTAVTGAAMLMRRGVFEALGGFDENHDVIKNDLDFCLRAGRAGLRVVYTPYARLTHHEMASRVHLPDSFDAVRFDGTWAIRQSLGDDLVNPNLARESDDFLAEPEPVQLLQAGPMLERDRVRRILVVKLDHIGDFICLLPALQRLHEDFPAAEITLLAPAASIVLAQSVTLIDHVVQFDFFAAKAASGRRAVSEAEFESLAAQLRPLRFDIALDCRTHPDTRHVLRYTGAAVLAGFDYGGRFPWLDIAVEWEGDLRLANKRTHVAHSLRRLAHAVGDAARQDPPGLTRPSPALVQTVTARLLQAGGAPPSFATRPLVCVHPGAGMALKQWPQSSYVGLIALLLHHHDVAVVLVGTGDEIPIAAEIASLAARPDAVLSLAGHVSLVDLPAVLCGSVLFVGNDSGPKHLAAALGVPTVGIHASHVDAAEWGPLGPRAIAVRRQMTCGPCYIHEESECPRALACLRGISPAQVYRACRLLLGLADGRVADGCLPAAVETSAASIATASRRPGRGGNGAGFSRRGATAG